MIKREKLAENVFLSDDGKSVIIVDQRKIPNSYEYLTLSTAEEMYDIIEAVEPHMPKDKTRYLMGVGTPSNIIEAVARGVDFFDCVMPARNARHARLFTWEGAINLKNAKYAKDLQPIDPQCDCPVCRRYSRAYIRHLFVAEEMLAMRLCVLHNLRLGTLRCKMSGILRFSEDD